MNSYNLLEFGSRGKIIFSAICDFQLGEQFFKKDDVVFALEDTFINFDYKNKTSGSTSKRNNIYYDECFLDSFSIRYVPLDLLSQRLFSTFYNSDTLVWQMENCPSQDNLIILKKVPENNTIRIEGIEQFKIISEDPCIISSEEFTNAQSYNVYYKYRVSGYKLNLDNEELDLPYLAAQIIFEGNNDKTSNVNYINIPRCALRTTPAMSLQNNSVSHLTMTFKIIEGEDKPTLSVIDCGN